MVNLLRYIIGYVSFAFCGGFTQGFVNDCFKNGYNLKNVEIKNGAVYAQCPAGLYPYLRRVARKNGGRLNIQQKHGLVFSLAKIKNRWGIFTGLVLGIALVCFVSGFIWSIEITGCETLSEKQISAFLESNGFREGVFWKSVDKDRLENLLLASFDEIAWAHINKNGTQARLEIGEGVLRPKTVNPKKYANLKAKKKGVIVKATVYDGWARVNAGDAVAKGDLLVSGIYSGEKGVTLYTRARGEYIAEVKEKFSLTVSRRQSYKRYLSVTKRKSLVLFGLEIPLYIGKTPKTAEITNEYDYLKLNGKRLPVGIKRQTVREYKNEVKILSDSELADLAEKETEKKIKSDFGKYEIIKRKIDTELLDDSAVSKGYLLCLENIGKEVRIKVKKVKN